MSSFNYIITIHNKQSLIEEVVLNVLRCMGPNSRLYPVLDGCTDDSEKIIDAIMQANPERQITKVFTDDVHELRAINAGLRAAQQDDEEGFNIVLQDDVVLQDIEMEKRLTDLYQAFDRLGIVSLRHGGNISRQLLTKAKAYIPIKDMTENVKGHNPNPVTQLPLGYFTYREIAIKSPICIPVKVVQEVGIPNEEFAPWDDMAYCYSVSAAGFNNGVFAMDFLSEKAWGTTRTKSQKLGNNAVHDKNVNLFKKMYAAEIGRGKLRSVYRTAPVKVFDVPGQKQGVSVLQYSEGLRKYIVSRMRRVYQIYFTPSKPHET